MNNRKILILILVGAVAGLILAPHREHYVVPLYAKPKATQTIPEPPPEPPGWLHVEVETNWAWFWQTTKGHAWVTASKSDTLPVDVGRICIRLTAHDTQQKCELGASRVSIQEKKRGVQIAKRTAIATAWTDIPELDTVTVRMEP